MTCTGLNSNTAEVCATVSITTTPMGRHPSVCSGKTITKPAESGRVITVHTPRLVSVIKHHMIMEVLQCLVSNSFKLCVFFLFLFKESLQNSERNRVSEQKNVPPFWEMRKKPPADWHLPLNEPK